MAVCGDGVTMQRDAMGTGDCADFGDWLQNARFIIGKMQAHQRRIRADGAQQIVRPIAAKGVARKGGECYAVLC